jgi:hypothetical protein
MGFVGRARRILIGSLVAVMIERLRMLPLPRGNFIAIDPDLIIFHPGGELCQLFGVVVFTDAGIQPVIPVVYATDEIVALDIPIRHQGTAMRATSVQDGNVVVVLHDDEVDSPHSGVVGFPILNITQGREGYGTGIIRH